MERREYRLGSQELEKLSSKFKDEKSLWEFWAEVASKRKLDHKTIIGHDADRRRFTALPIGHKQHWCFPFPLKCAKPPPKDLKI